MSNQFAFDLDENLFNIKDIIITSQFPPFIYTLRNIGYTTPSIPLNTRQPALPS